MVRKVRAHDPNKVATRPPAPVEVKRMAHPKVWAQAVKLANGDISRITVESYCRVSILTP